MAREEKRLPGEPGGHRITLVARQRLTVSGVNGVERFDEDSIALSTENGRLLVQGEDLHIEKLKMCIRDRKTYCFHSLWSYWGTFR